jgi:hypothetical protein
MTDPQLYVVEVDDQCDHRLAGHTGCSYTSPPQFELQALSLVGALLGDDAQSLSLADAPWSAAIGRWPASHSPAPRSGQRTAPVRSVVETTPRAASTQDCRRRSSCSTTRTCSPPRAARSSKSCSPRTHSSSCAPQARCSTGPSPPRLRRPTCSSSTSDQPSRTTSSAPDTSGSTSSSGRAQGGPTRSSARSTPTPPGQRAYARALHRELEHIL